MQHYSEGYIPSQQQTVHAEQPSQGYRPDELLSPINLLHEGQQHYQEQPSGYSHQQVPPNWQGQPQQQHYYAAPQFIPVFSISEPGVDGKILAAFSYLGCWVTGLIVLLFARENRFLRFHAMQSLVFYGGVNLIYIAFFGLMSAWFHHWHMAPFLWMALVLGFVLVNIIAGVAWLVGIVGALSGKYLKLPFVGDFAEQYANRHPTPPTLH